jgi:integrase
MAGIYRRRRKLWARYRNERGVWVSEKTPFAVGQEEAASKYVAKLQRDMDKARATLAGNAPPLTLEAYVLAWIVVRERRGLRGVKHDRARLLNHLVPRLGARMLADITKVDMRDLVRWLCEPERELAPRTVRHIYGLTRTMFSDALLEGKVEVNPCQLARRDLPAKTDADPEWRAAATYTLGEVQLLITDERIAVERRVQYALKAIAGLRHGEVAGLRWRHYDATIEPLGRLLIATSYNNKRTKTDVTRRVPVHPTLAAILAAWKLSHWERVYGRVPQPDDLVVPARTMRPITANAAHKVFKDDLAKVGLRVEAGTKKRGGHDLRSWFITTCQEHGAHRDLLRVITHTSKSDVMDGYTRAPWPALCAELGKLRISVLDGKVLALATRSATRDLTLLNRWRNMATPTGFERKISTAPPDSTPQDHENTHAPSGAERIERVANLATRLADAVLAGEHDTARVLAEQIRDLTKLRLVHLQAVSA